MHIQLVLKRQIARKPFALISNSMKLYAHFQFLEFFVMYDSHRRQKNTKEMYLKLGKGIFLPHCDIILVDEGMVTSLLNLDCSRSSISAQ